MVDNINEHSYKSIGTKIAISRAATTCPPTLSGGRVSRACEVCRKRKTKCSGHSPCQRCRSHGLKCEYGDNESERITKQVRQASEQVKDYEKLLAFLLPKLQHEDAQIVQNILRKNNAETASVTIGDGSTDSVTFASSASTTRDTEDRGRSDANLFDLLHTVSGRVEEDLNRNDHARALGLIGKHSEISWLLDLKQYVGGKYRHVCQSKDYEMHNGGELPSIATVSYFLDDSNIPMIEDAEVQEHPPKGTAMTCIDQYFKFVHPSFPIIAKGTFVKQVEKFYASSFVRPGRNWLGIFNLILAIASHRSQCALLTPSAHGKANCLKYFTRARKLCMADGAILHHSSLQQIQFEGLCSFYLLNIGHCNRAWKLCGMALRSSLAMALHLRNENPHLPAAWKSARYHVWWSLVTLEVTLCVITGRPLNIIRGFCTAPLIDPHTRRQYVNLDELVEIQPATVTLASPKSMWTFRTSHGPLARQTVNLSEAMITVYFACYANLLQITGEVVEVLYTKHSITTTELCEMQTRVTQLHIKAEKWHSDLPESLQHSPERPHTFAECYGVKLALQYHSTKLLIGKPFLDLLGYCGNEIPSFYVEKALSCVKAAHDILNLFPNEYDRTWLMEVAPAWSILHFLLQATTVLIIQFSSSCSSPLPCPNLVLEKSGRWLSELSVYDSAARRAQGICAMLLSRLSVIVNCNKEP